MTDYDRDEDHQGVISIRASTTRFAATIIKRPVTCHVHLMKMSTRADGPVTDIPRLSRVGWRRLSPWRPLRYCPRSALHLIRFRSCARHPISDGNADLKTVADPFLTSYPDSSVYPARHLMESTLFSFFEHTPAPNEG